MKVRKLIVGLILMIFFGWGHGWLASNGGGIMNSGVSFGWQVSKVVLFDLVLCFLFIFLVIKTESWGLMLMAVGGSINLMERIRLGYVSDYWNILNSGLYNNVNDWLIFIGAILVVVEILWKKRLK